MKNLIMLGMLILFSASATAVFLPEKHIELLPYVQEAPDQGDTGACKFMATTGAVELLLNQKYNIRSPKKGDIFDLSEIFTINHAVRTSNPWQSEALPRLSQGWAISENELTFKAWTSSGKINNVWKRPGNFYQLPRVKIPHSFSAEKLFIRGGKYAKYVIKPGDIQTIKKALVENNSPVLINYNHNRWWHMVIIVGYDDTAKGVCLHTPEVECSKVGAFYVRDSLGEKTHLRDYDWFRVNGNAAFSIQLKN